jgi:hypothetical protein
VRGSWGEGSQGRGAPEQGVPGVRVPRVRDTWGEGWSQKVCVVLSLAGSSV